MLGMLHYIPALLFVVLPIVSYADGNDISDKLTFYLRNTLYEYSPNLLTLNGLYDYHAPWMTIQYGARVGESHGNLGAWSYKLELTSKNYLEHYRVSVRLVKGNLYVPNLIRDTAIVERFIGSFDPFEDWEALNKLHIETESGFAEKFSSTTGSAVLPSTNGSVRLIPLFSLKLSYRADSAQNIYSLAFANFDVFDPYPASQPFLQIEANHKLDKYNVFEYIRYRWDDSISHLYALYIALGLEIPD